jgi:hypothetical protein
MSITTLNTVHDAPVAPTISVRPVALTAPAAARTCRCG